MPALLQAAGDAGLAVGFHLEPYPGRSAASVRADVEYISARYGHHPALHRSSDGRPVYFVYDSYHIQARDWAAMLQAGGSASIRCGAHDVRAHTPAQPQLSRPLASVASPWCCCGLLPRGTPADGVFVGLWLSRNDGAQLHAGGFDGAYTYFASAGFSYGSTPQNWPSMSDFCRAHGMAFVPSVGPGYDDSRIRPWYARLCFVPCSSTVPGSYPASRPGLGLQESPYTERPRRWKVLQRHVSPSHRLWPVGCHLHHQLE